MNESSRLKEYFNFGMRDPVLKLMLMEAEESGLKMIDGFHIENKKSLPMPWTRNCSYRREDYLLWVQK